MAIHEVFAYLRVRNATKAIAFYERAFGAKENFRLAEPSGRVGHCELDFGGTTVMVSDEFPEAGIRGPQSVGGTTMAMHLHVDDADQVIGQALAAGAVLVRAASDHFYGERSGTVRDPFGHEWVVGHDLETLTPEEMQRRYTEMLTG